MHLYSNRFNVTQEVDAGGCDSNSPPSLMSRFAKGVEPSLGFATGSQAWSFGFVLHRVSYGLNLLTNHHDIRRVRPICGSSERHVDFWLCALPRSKSDLQNLVLAGGLVNHVAHPRMPTWLYVTCIKLLVFVVDLPVLSSTQVIAFFGCIPIVCAREVPLSYSRSTCCRICPCQLVYQLLCHPESPLELTHSNL